MAAISGYDFIGKVKLYTTYEIFKQKNRFIIRSKSRNDPSKVFESLYDKGVVMKLKKEYSGRSVSVYDVIDDIEDQKFSINLRYKYGHKQRFEIQGLLTILCALGLAKIKKEGRKFIYEVK